MQNFSYINPCQIVFGKDKIGELDHLVSRHGKRLLFVYGENSLKKSGTYDSIVQSLKKADVFFVEHGGVRSNPVLSHVIKGIAIAKKYKVDCILAVGGGSVIDEAKAVAFGALTDQDIWAFFENKKKPDKALPIISIPTLPASGSETNPGVVLTNDHTGEKTGLASRSLIPKLSILDPSVTFTVPHRYMAFGFVDAFSHVMEGYFNGEHLYNTILDDLAESQFRSIIETACAYQIDPKNYEVRADAMWAACLAHNGLNYMGRGKIIFEIHSIAHILGAQYDLPHGAAIALVIPAWMMFRMDQLDEKMRRFGKNVFSMTKGESNEPAIKTLRRTKKWINDITHMTSLREFGAEIKTAPAIIKEIETAVISGELRKANRSEIERLVDNLFEQ